VSFWIVDLDLLFQIGHQAVGPEVLAGSDHVRGVGALRHFLPRAVGVDAITGHGVYIGVDAGLDMAPGNGVAAAMVFVRVADPCGGRVGGACGAGGGTGIVTGQEKESLERDGAEEDGSFHEDVV